MTPDELHELLLTLKGKDASSVNIAETKALIRAELRDYRTEQPSPTVPPYTPPWMLNSDPKKDIVFYSFLNNPERPMIAEHEYKRLKISWESLRKHNKTIEVRFCLDGCTEHEYHIWQTLCEANSVELYPFHEAFDRNLPNAWCIHRWYNLALWADENLNVLYLDADTYINADIQMLFDLYRRDAVYGREELGFRHDPNSGISGEDPRFFLDLVDASIVAQGGKTEVQKYCLGAILLNHNTHRYFDTENLAWYSDLLRRIHAFEVFYSIPNYRIMDEFAFWVLMSRLSLRTALFGDQDVSQTFMEKKHETHFNPIVLHYTTKDEEKFADWSPEFAGLSRSNEEREDSDIGGGGIYNVNPVMREELAMSMW